MFLLSVSLPPSFQRKGNRMGSYRECLAGTLGILSMIRPDIQILKKKDHQAGTLTEIR